MIPNNPHSLENFAERHRADFDVHEPRPDLWAVLEQELDAQSPGIPVPIMAVASAETSQETKARSRNAAGSPGRPTAPPLFRRYGIAAALAALVLAAGAGEIWKTRQPAAEVAAANGATPNGTSGADDAALYLGDEPQAMLSGARGDSNSIRLASAVRGMEAYYSSQLSSRQAALSQLSGPGVAGMAADWQRELAALDSSYRQLKLQLPGHPQPEAVLTAMNRNLQIRLDILDQQLHLGNARPIDEDRGAYVLADSRQPE